MVRTSLLEQIDATEAAIQAAWARRDGETAQRLQEHSRQLWRQRRAELARQHTPILADSAWSFEASLTPRRAAR